MLLKGEYPTTSGVSEPVASTAACSAPVLDEKRLSWADPGVFLLDLASAPGGIDQEAAKARGLRLTRAPGLPGRTAPVTAAAAIRESVYHILREEGGHIHG